VIDLLISKANSSIIGKIDSVILKVSESFEYFSRFKSHAVTRYVSASFSLILSVSCITLIRDFPPKGITLVNLKIPFQLYL